VVSIASNSVTFIDTATNAIKAITYVGRSPHEAFFTPDDSEVWVTVRGEDYVQVIDGRTYENKDRIYVGDGPGMTIFRPDGKYGYVCSSFLPETKVVEVKSHHIVGTFPQASPFCPNMMRRLAEEIVVDQQSEIQAMQLWLSKQPTTPEMRK
jgi:YVTN family beta-propeller protein